MNCIGIYLNVDKDDAPELAGQVFQWLHNKGISVYVPQDQSKYLSLSIPGLQWEEYIRLVQMVIVLGGDGTLLAATRKLSPAGVPVFGVNLGHLGFLTSVEPSNLFEILTEILAEEYEIEQRMMLIAKVNRKGSNVYQYLALNEVVVTKSAFLTHNQATNIYRKWNILPHIREMV
jgi:NAD+ kinase